ncbi:UNVERIFIED_CONTAM: hypothetical protein FKN15_068191 [Acipenser sinensis]
MVPTGAGSRLVEPGPGVSVFCSPNPVEPGPGVSVFCSPNPVEPGPGVSVFCPFLSLSCSLHLSLPCSQVHRNAVWTQHTLIFLEKRNTSKLSSAKEEQQQDPGREENQGSAPGGGKSQKETRLLLPESELKRGSWLAGAGAGQTCGDRQLTAGDQTDRCYSSFNLRECLPRKLHCGHTFCQDCLRRLDTVLNEQRWIPCPQCRQNTPCPRGGAGALDLDLTAFLAAKTQAETHRASTRQTGAEPPSNVSSGKQQLISEQPSVWGQELPSEPRFPRSPCCCRCC